MKAIIIAGGTLPSKELIAKETIKNTIIIAADSGANHLYRHKIIPHYLIGDLDSINIKALNFCINNGVIIKRYPIDKNFTDAELALKKAVKLKISKVTFLGCLGGLRTDHLLGNLGLLDKCMNLNISASLKDDYQTITLLRKSIIISGKIGAGFSLHAYGKTVKHLSVIGGKYPLKNYDLKIGDALTLSNKFSNKRVKISFKSGKLLLITNT